MKASILPLILCFVLCTAVVSSQTTDRSILDEDSLFTSVTVSSLTENDILFDRNIEPEPQTSTEDAPIIVRKNDPIKIEKKEDDEFIADADQDTSGSETVENVQTINETTNATDINLKADLSPDNQSNVAVNNSANTNDSQIVKQANPVRNDKAQLHHLIPHVPPHLFPLVRPLFFARHDDNSPESHKFNVLCNPDNRKRVIDSGRFQQFFMNPKNHDVMFSICGRLFPAHKIVIESSSPFLAKVIEQFQEDSPQLPVNVNIDSFDAFIALINGDELVPSPASDGQCHQQEFIESFQVLLKYFYAGEVALDDITNLKSALLFINIAKPTVTQAGIEQAVVERIGSLMTLDDIATVHRFAREQGSLNLKETIKMFIHKNRAQIIANNVTHLPIECEDADLEYVDDYISSLDVSQAQAIAYISYLMNNCPDFGPKVKELQNAKINPFQNSISLYRSNVADLKHLVKLGFITYEILAQELENRLRLAEGELEAVRINPPMIHQRRFSEIIPSASHNVQQFFRLNPIIRKKLNQRA